MGLAACMFSDFFLDCCLPLPHFPPKCHSGGKRFFFFFAQGGKGVLDLHVFGSPHHRGKLVIVSTYLAFIAKKQDLFLEATLCASSLWCFWF